MKQTVSMAKGMVPSATASPKAAVPVFVLCALGMALAVASLCLLWIGYPPTTTTSLDALADSALAERAIEALHWYMAHAPHSIPLPLIHLVDGGPTGNLMMVETKTLFA